MNYTLPGNPIPMIRSRDQQQRKTWNESRGHKAKLEVILTDQHGDNPPLRGPLCFHIAFYFEHPQHVNKIHTPIEEERYRYHVAHPRLLDLVNFIESLGRGIIFSNDYYIAAISAKKCYDDTPRTELAITVLE